MAAVDLISESGWGDWTGVRGVSVGPIRGGYRQDWIDHFAEQVYTDGELRERRERAHSVLEPLRLKELGFERVAGDSWDELSVWKAGGVVPPRPETVVVPIEAKNEVVETLRKSGIGLTEETGGAMLVHEWINLVFGSGGWRTHETIAHENLHGWRKPLMIKHHIGKRGSERVAWRRGFISGKPEAKYNELHGVVPEEGLAVLTSFDYLMSRRYRDGHRVEFANMIRELDPKGGYNTWGLKFGIDYAGLFSKFVEKTFGRGGEKELYRAAAYTVYYLLAAARGVEEYGYGGMMRDLMAVRLDGSKMRVLKDRIDQVAGDGVARELFQIRWRQEDMPRLVRLANRLGDKAI